MANRFPRTNRVQRKRPNRSWSASVLNSFTAVPAASKVLLGSFTLSNTNIDETILRSVGVLGITSDQQAASEVQMGAFGIIPVSDAALAIGITAIPGPFTDGADDGWFLYVPIVQAMEFGTAVGLHPDWAQRYPFDSRAKRVVHEGQSLAIVVENSNGTHGFEAMFQMRLLSMVTGT